MKDMMDEESESEDPGGARWRALAREWCLCDVKIFWGPWEFWTYLDGVIGQQRFLMDPNCRP